MMTTEERSLFLMAATMVSVRESFARMVADKELCQKIAKQYRESADIPALSFNEWFQDAKRDER